MDTIQLTKAMTQNRYTKKNFRGIFPSDRLPGKVKRPALIIANTDEASKPGQHWVAFYMPKRGPTEYFDSIGRPPLLKNFQKFILKNGTNYKTNDQRLQGSFSTTCGNYCAVYLLHRAKKGSLKKFYQQFTNNYEENDRKIVKMFQKGFQQDQIGANSSIICNQSCQPTH